MGLILDQQRLEFAFEGRPDLIGAIQQAAAAPNWIELFNEITKYVSGLRTSPPSSESSSKKRKLDNTLPTHPSPNGKVVKTTITDKPNPANETSLLQINDISVVIPQRKKFTLEFTASYIRAIHPETKEAIPGISYAWKDIAYAFCLPVPEKAQKQHNYILFPKNSNISTPRHLLSSEPLAFTIPVTAPKLGSIFGSEASTAASVSDSYKTLFDYFLSRHLKAAGNNVTIVEANEKHFASVLREAHRPNEKAVHVKAFRGSKDGFLFFLSTGLLFGFKKPLLFLPKEHISAVSCTNVLQRTFNLNVEVYLAQDKAQPGDEEEKVEFEFAMIDQEDFEGIGTYTKRNGLQDASMAEQRRAKRLGINAVKGEDGTITDTGDAGELEKAEAELQDEEDEEEEDYDPGSEGESEGSGSSSDEDDGDDDGDGGGDAEAEDDEDEDEEEDL